MATDNQIEANRQNAQHCTGPKTEEGKARSSQNALKTGLYSQKEVIATESRDDYESLAAEYHNHYAPANPHERSLVDALVCYEWLSRRYMAADTALWNFCLVDNKIPVGKAFMYHAENLSRAGRYFNNARKGFSATLKELQILQERRKSEPKPEIAATERPAAEPQTAPNQVLGGKLVSFRQPAESPHKNPELLAPAGQKTRKRPRWRHDTKTESVGLKTYRSDALSERGLSLELKPRVTRLKVCFQQK